MSGSQPQTFTVERVLDVAIKDKKIKFCLKWDGFNDPEDNTWEPPEHLEDLSVVELFIVEQKALKRETKDPGKKTKIKEKINLCRKARKIWSDLSGVEYKRVSSESEDSQSLSHHSQVQKEKEKNDQAKEKKGQNEIMQEETKSEKKQTGMAIENQEKKKEPKSDKKEKGEKSMEEQEEPDSVNSSINKKKIESLKEKKKKKDPNGSPRQSKVTFKDPKPKRGKGTSENSVGGHSSPNKGSGKSGGTGPILKDSSFSNGGSRNKEKTINVPEETKKDEKTARREKNAEILSGNIPGIVELELTNSAENSVIGSGKEKGSGPPSKLEKAKEERDKLAAVNAQLKKERKHFKKECERISRENADLKAKNETLLKKRESNQSTSSNSKEIDAAGSAAKGTSTRGVSRNYGYEIVSDDDLDKDEGRLDHDKIAKIDGCISVGNELLVEVIWKPSGKTLIKQPRLVPIQLLLNSSSTREMAHSFITKRFEDVSISTKTCKKEFEKIKEANKLLICHYKEFISSRLAMVNQQVEPV